ncbi:MAG TPA: STAS domain-containing protein [Candidatus Hydrogenedentes bacterium]|nr:STAS domain-containing protein [Candidatus Hydrogenedentota bacterium]HPG67398.1 STAS domain-containing protein [Candidatus Hydrogenedentota bacterium]
MALQIEESERDGQYVIAVAGEVDLYTSPELRNAVIKAVPKRVCNVVALDLSQVGYMDSSGVATLVEGLKLSHQKNVAFQLVAPSKPVMKVLQLARLDSVFKIVDRI